MLLSYCCFFILLSPVVSGQTAEYAAGRFIQNKIPIGVENFRGKVTIMSFSEVVLTESSLNISSEWPNILLIDQHVQMKMTRSHLSLIDDNTSPIRSGLKLGPQCTFTMSMSRINISGAMHIRWYSSFMAAADTSIVVEWESQLGFDQYSKFSLTKASRVYLSEDSGIIGTTAILSMDNSSISLNKTFWNLMKGVEVVLVNSQVNLLQSEIKMAPKSSFTLNTGSRVKGGNLRILLGEGSGVTFAPNTFLINENFIGLNITIGAKATLNFEGNCVLKKNIVVPDYNRVEFKCS